MKRRQFITLLGGAAATWPVAARGQQAALPVVGLLGNTFSAIDPYVAAFRQGLKESGYVEGQNVAIEYRRADGHNDRWPALAADLVGRHVNVIASMGGTPAALAAKAATTAIPIVFMLGNDPVQAGLVASLSRPGGNLTGVTTLNVDLGPKKLEVLHELIPAAATIALVVNPTNPNADALSRDAQAAAGTLGLQLHVLHASNEREIDAAFADLVRLRAGGLAIGGDPFLGSRSGQLAALALRYGVPAIYSTREFAEAGGLVTYGGGFADADRLAGGYVGRILKGEKPANLPVQQATKVELFINLKTAKALGVTVPPALLATADEVIE
jgi:putative tryptophan/tyrosine transport system substrate-binding protein